MKKALAILLIVLALVVCGTYFYFKGKRYEVVITQEQIDTGLSERFPASKKFLLIFTVTYSNPQVTLLENENRVEVGLDAKIDFRLNDELKELGGGATVTSGIRYDNETQEFFLVDTEVSRFEVQGIPKKWLIQVTEIASRVAQQFIESKPIYQLEGKDAKTHAAKLLLKEVEVRDQEVHVTLGL